MKITKSCQEVILSGFGQGIQIHVHRGRRRRRRRKLVGFLFLFGSKRKIPGIKMKCEEGVGDFVGMQSCNNICTWRELPANKERLGPPQKWHERLELQRGESVSNLSFSALKLMQWEFYNLWIQDHKWDYTTEFVCPDWLVPLSSQFDLSPQRLGAGGGNLSFCVLQIHRWPFFMSYPDEDMEEPKTLESLPINARWKFWTPFVFLPKWLTPWESWKLDSA